MNKTDPKPKPKKERDLEKLTLEVLKNADRYKKSTFKRFPLLFVGLSTFGLVAVLYSFEKVIDQIPFLANNPLLVLLVGISSLAFTGTLYKKLK